MKLRMSYWKDDIGGVIEQTEVELEHFAYKIAPVVKWKSLIADEDVCVEAGQPTIVKVKTLEIPENTVVGPLHIMMHALGCVVDVVECGIPGKVEDDKCIDQALFLPIESDEIKKGDLLGLLRIFFVKTGLLSRILNLSTPEVEVGEEVDEANLCWKVDGNIFREKINIGGLRYDEAQEGYLKPIIAAERVRVQKGDAVTVSVKKLNLPPYTVIVPIGAMFNVFGVLVDLIQLGKPSKMEEDRVIHQAVFMAVDDGIVEEGDLLGVVSVYGGGIVKADEGVERANIVYRRGAGIIREEITMEGVEFRSENIATWEVLVSEENKKLRRGEPAIISVKAVKLPKNTITYPLSIMRHAYGSFLSVYMHTPPKKFEDEDRIVDKIVFLPVLDGEVRKGELLGVLNIQRVSKV